jgi:hypothetical protein
MRKLKKLLDWTNERRRKGDFAMNTELEATELGPTEPEPIVNKKMFPTALPAKAGMDTHMLQPEEAILPLPAETNDLCREAIERTCKELADKNFVDRRNPVELRTKLRQIEEGGGNMRGRLATIQGKIAEAEKIVGALKKLQKHWSKSANRFAGESLDQIQRRLDVVSENLARLKRQEVTTKKDISANAQALKDFMGFRPRPDLQKNSELLADFEEASRLEAEIKKMEYQTSLRPGSVFQMLS